MSIHTVCASAEVLTSSWSAPNFPVQCISFSPSSLWEQEDA